MRTDTQRVAFSVYFILQAGTRTQTPADAIRGRIEVYGQITDRVPTEYCRFPTDTNSNIFFNEHMNIHSYKNKLIEHGLYTVRKCLPSSAISRLDIPIPLLV